MSPDRFEVRPDVSASLAFSALACLIITLLMGWLALIGTGALPGPDAFMYSVVVGAPAFAALIAGIAAVAAGWVWHWRGRQREYATMDENGFCIERPGRPALHVAWADVGEVRNDGDRWRVLDVAGKELLQMRLAQQQDNALLDRILVRKWLGSPGLELPATFAEPTRSRRLSAAVVGVAGTVFLWLVVDMWSVTLSTRANMLGSAAPDMHSLWASGAAMTILCTVALLAGIALVTKYCVTRVTVFSDRVVWQTLAGRRSLDFGDVDRVDCRRRCAHLAARGKEIALPIAFGGEMLNLELARTLFLAHRAAPSKMRGDPVVRPT